jgi:hypothetical protein
MLKLTEEQKLLQQNIMKAYPRLDELMAGMIARMSEDDLEKFSKRIKDDDPLMKPPEELKEKDLIIKDAVSIE